MKSSGTIGLTLAAVLLFACAPSRQAAAPLRAARQARQAEEDRREAQREAREDANREKEEAEEAALTERGTERNAPWAGERAALADAQATKRAPGRGAAERQAENADESATSTTVVLFEADSAALSPGARATLDGLADTLAREADMDTVIVNGYTDDLGTEALNAEASEERAVEVARYLENKGVAATRIETHALGPRRFVTSETTDKSRALDRRVEITIR